MWKPKLPLRDTNTHLEAAANPSSLSSQPALFYPLLLLFFTVLKLLSLFLNPDHLHFVLSKAGSWMTSRSRSHLYILVQCFVPSTPRVSALTTQPGMERFISLARKVMVSFLKELFLKPAGQCPDLPCFETVICLHVLYT